ncbi:MAG: hypothetical protein U0528_12520 [Anaerolineae bacterium]
MTRRNVPAEIENIMVRAPMIAIHAILDQGNLYKSLVAGGAIGALLDAYPPWIFRGIESGQAIVVLVTTRGQISRVPIRTHERIILLVGRSVLIL